MDGKGSYNDNLFIERLWRTVKYEEVYLKAYQDGRDARAGIGDYFRFYNTQRPHQALGYKTPAEEYFSERVVIIEEAMIESGEQDIHLLPQSGCQDTTLIQSNSCPTNGDHLS